MRIRFGGYLTRAAGKEQLEFELKISDIEQIGKARYEYIQKGVNYEEKIGNKDRISAACYGNLALRTSHEHLC